jgi:magnesium transporter
VTPLPDTTPRAIATKARLFDADRSDKVVELTPDALKSVGNHQLLWIDAVLTGKASDSTDLIEMLPFDRAAVETMWESSSLPRLSVHGDWFLLRVLALPPDDTDKPIVLDLAVGKNVVLTAHREPVEFLTDLNDRIRGDTTLGEIDSTDFATVLIDGLITSYLELTDGILAKVDELDGEALEATGSGDLLAELVALRHRIAQVRRVLVAHRRVIAATASADFEVITGKTATPRFASMTERFDGAIAAIDTAREALLGTFDIHMSRTAQRTNDVVKVLTIVSVLLLPAGVLAGFMGMNIKAPYSNDDPTIFWFVLAAIALIAGLTVLALRLRRWL